MNKAFFYLAVVCTSASTVWSQPAEPFSASMNACLDQTLALNEQNAACAVVLDNDDVADDHKANMLVSRAEVLIYESELGEALVSYLTAINLDPQNDAAREGLHLLNRVFFEMLDEDPDKVIEYANRGLYIDPENSRLVALRGDAQVHLGNVEDGLRDINRAMELDLFPHLFQLKRAEINFELGRFDDAHSDLFFIIDDSSSSGTLERKVRAELSSASGIEAERLTVWLNAVPILLGKALNLQVVTHIELGDRPAAIDASIELAELEPENTANLRLLGALLVLTSRLDEALAVLDEAIRLARATEQGDTNTELVTALKQRSGLYSRLDQNDLALTDLEEAIAKSPVAVIEAFQAALSELGFYDEDINGEYDEATKSATITCLQQNAC